MSKRQRRDACRRLNSNDHRSLNADSKDFHTNKYPLVFNYFLCRLVNKQSNLAVIRSLTEIVVVRSFVRANNSSSLFVVVVVVPSCFRHVPRFRKASLHAETRSLKRIIEIQQGKENDFSHSISRINEQRDERERKSVLQRTRVFLTA